MINFSELLWKSGRTSEQGTGTAAVVGSTEIRIVSGLNHAPVEKVKLHPGNRVALLTDSRSAGVDRVRFLRMRRFELRQLAKLRSVVITSSMPKDGKSTIAMSLAATLSEQGQRTVLLIEADLDRPTLAKSLGLRPRPGLAECLEDGLAPLSQLRKVDPLGWYSVQAGSPRGNPTELIQSGALKTVLERPSP